MSHHRPQPGDMVQLEDVLHLDHGQTGRLVSVNGPSALVTVFGVGQKRWPYASIIALASTAGPGRR